MSQIADKKGQSGPRVRRFRSFGNRATVGWIYSKAAVLRHPAITSGIGQFAGVQAVPPSFGVELSPVDVRDAGEIERAVMAFARSTSNGA